MVWLWLRRHGRYGMPRNRQPVSHFTCKGGRTQNRTPLVAGKSFRDLAKHGLVVEIGERRELADMEVVVERARDVDGRRRKEVVTRPRSKIEEARGRNEPGPELLVQCDDR